MVVKQTKYHEPRQSHTPSMSWFWLDDTSDRSWEEREGKSNMVCPSRLSLSVSLRAYLLLVGIPNGPLDPTGGTSHWALSFFSMSKSLPGPCPCFAFWQSCLASRLHLVGESGTIQVEDHRSPPCFQKKPLFALSLQDHPLRERVPACILGPSHWGWTAAHLPAVHFWEVPLSNQAVSLHC